MSGRSFPTPPIPSVPNPERVRARRDDVIRELAGMIQAKRDGRPYNVDRLEELRFDRIVLDDLLDIAMRQAVG